MTVGDLISSLFIAFSVSLVIGYMLGRVAIFINQIIGN